VLDKHFITVDIEVELIRVFEVKEGGGRVEVKYKNNRLCAPHRRPPLEASFGASMVLLNLTVGYDPSFIKRQMFWKYVPHKTFCRYPHVEAIGSVSSYQLSQSQTIDILLSTMELLSKVRGLIIEAGYHELFVAFAPFLP
jgi:hypothetical protein